MPRRLSSSPPPTPESLRSWIEPIEPAARITSPRQRADRATPFCRQRTPAARGRRAGAEKMVLMPAEERQHVVGAPAGEPKLAPVVVIGGLAAHIDHGVDG